MIYWPWRRFICPESPSMRHQDAAHLRLWAAALCWATWDSRLSILWRLLVTERMTGIESVTRVKTWSLKIPDFLISPNERRHAAPFSFTVFIHSMLHRATQKGQQVQEIRASYWKDVAILWRGERLARYHQILDDVEQSKSTLKPPYALIHLQTLSANDQYRYIPMKHVVAKRLAQCLNPALPSGVHTKAIETYTVILGNIGARSTIIWLLWAWWL